MFNSVKRCGKFSTYWKYYTSTITVVYYRWFYPADEGYTIVHVWGGNALAENYFTEYVVLSLALFFDTASWNVTATLRGNAW